METIYLLKGNAFAPALQYVSVSSQKTLTKTMAEPLWKECSQFSFMYLSPIASTSRK